MRLQGRRRWRINWRDLIWPATVGRMDLGQKRRMAIWNEQERMKAGVLGQHGGRIKGGETLQGVYIPLRCLY